MSLFNKPKPLFSEEGGAKENQAPPEIKSPARDWNHKPGEPWTLKRIREAIMEFVKLCALLLVVALGFVLISRGIGYLLKLDGDSSSGARSDNSRAAASTTTYNPQPYVIPTPKPPSGYFCSEQELSVEKDPNTVGKWSCRVPANYKPEVDRRFLMTGYMELIVESIKGKVIVDPKRQNKDTASDWMGTKLLPIPSTGRLYEHLRGYDDDPPLAGALIAECYELRFENDKPVIASKPRTSWILKPGLELSGNCAVAIKVEDTNGNPITGDRGYDDNLGDNGEDKGFFPGGGFIVNFKQLKTMNKIGMKEVEDQKIHMPELEIN